MDGMTQHSSGAISCLADPPGKPALLLMHGFLSSRHHWQPNQQALRQRYRLVIAELPGHGLSPSCTDPAALTPAALAADLEQLRQQLGISDWHLCGQSFGAGLVLRYALDWPAPVRSVLWTNANRALGEPMSGDELAAQLARAEAIELGGVEALRREKFHPRFAWRFPAGLRAQLSQDADSSHLPTIAALIRHTIPQLALGPELGRLNLPVMLVNGTLERRFQPGRDRAAALIPGLEIVDLPGGHSVNIEQADGFNAAALEFFARFDPPADA